MCSQSWKTQTLMPRHVQGVATDGSTVLLCKAPSWPCTSLPGHRQLFPEESVRTATSAGPHSPGTSALPGTHTTSTVSQCETKAPRQLHPGKYLERPQATRQLPDSGNQLRNLCQAVMFRSVMWGNEADTPQHGLRVSAVFGSKR